MLLKPEQFFPSLEKFLKSHSEKSCIPPCNDWNNAILFFYSACLQIFLIFFSLNPLETMDLVCYG